MLLCSLFRNVYSVLYHIPQLSDCLLKEESTSLIGFNKKSSYSSPHMKIHSAINKMDSLSSCSQFTAESTTTNEFDLASDDSSSSESMGEDEQRKMIENVPFLQCPSFSPQKLGHLSISSTSTSETINELNSTVCPSPSISPDLDQLVIEEVKNSDEVHDVEENPSSLSISLSNSVYSCLVRSLTQSVFDSRSLTNYNFPSFFIIYYRRVFLRT